MQKQNYNTDWKEWKKKFGGKYYGHISRINLDEIGRRFGFNIKFEPSLDISQLDSFYKKTKQVKTRTQPKQVVFSKTLNLVCVSCMEGFLQIFSRDLNIIKEFSFAPYKCVEVALVKNICIVSLSKFSRKPNIKDYIVLINLNSMKIVSQVCTQGSWSKVIQPYNKHTIFVSNWRSNDLSIFNIEDINNPKLIQKLPCGIAPRGIAFTKSGEGLVAGFYSRNIIHIKSNADNLFKLSYIGTPFNYPKPSGNMRHILIDKNNQYAYISNLGLNLLHIYNIRKREIEDSILVGKNPNTIIFADDKKTKILISCRGDNKVLLFDIKSRRVVGVTDISIQKSTGLCRIDDENFLATDFLDNYLIKFNKIVRTNMKPELIPFLETIFIFAIFPFSF